MGGIVGRIFREFAVTLSLAVSFSMVISLTTTPAMCAKFLKPEKDRKHNWLGRTSESGFDRLYDGYASSLRWVLRHQPLVLGITLGTICLAIYLYVVIPKGFFPQQDTGRINGNARATEDTSFQTMQQKLNEYIAILKTDPAVRDCVGLCHSRECRLPQYHLEAASRAQGQRVRGHESAATQTGSRSGSNALYGAAYRTCK